MTDAHTALLRPRLRRTPMYHAAEASECGLACLAMIAKYHGHDVDLPGLRQRFSLSMAGATLKDLMSLADKLSFSSRAIKLPLDQLANLPCPAILHWDFNHFVVLVSANRRTVRIHDPSFGERTLTIEEVSNHFTGVVLELTPAEVFKPQQAKRPTRLSSLWTRLHGFWGAFGQILILSLVVQLTAYALPLYLQTVVDSAVTHFDSSLLTVLAMGFGGLILVQVLVFAARSYALAVLGQMLTFQLIGNIVRHLLRLKIEFFEKRHVGDILSRIQSTRPIQDALTAGSATAIIDGFMAVIGLIILFVYSVKLSIVVLFTLVLSLIVTFAFFPHIRQKSEEALNASAREQSHVIESVRASRTVKLMGKEAQRESVWRNLLADAMNARFSVIRVEIIQEALQSALVGLQVVLVIYLGANAILAGDGFSVGMLIAFLSFRQSFSESVTNLINQAIQFRLLGLHLDRIGDIIHSEPEAEISGTEHVAPFQGHIQASGVTFRYGTTDRPVLEAADLDVSAGEFLAITGPSGGGKTTLLKLLLGLHLPETGEIRLDGERAGPALHRAWRDSLSVVSQDDQLLAGSLADNIAFFDADTDMERVVDAARQARIHDQISEMPMRYLSLVGDMGSTLSSGQKQRILLARALYRAPSILVMDEGTANLDIANEIAIADLIASMSITRIIVAHRMALLERADRIVWVEQGRIQPWSIEQHLAHQSATDATGR